MSTIKTSTGTHIKEYNASKIGKDFSFLFPENI
jgi:hypothetical protein